MYFDFDLRERLDEAIEDAVSPPRPKAIVRMRNRFRAVLFQLPEDATVHELMEAME